MEVFFAEAGPFLAQSTARLTGSLFKFTSYRSAICGQHMSTSPNVMLLQSIDVKSFRENAWFSCNCTLVCWSASIHNSSSCPVISNPLSPLELKFSAQWRTWQTSKIEKQKRLTKLHKIIQFIIIHEGSTCKLGWPNLINVQLSLFRETGEKKH